MRSVGNTECACVAASFLGLALAQAQKKRARARYKRSNGFWSRWMSARAQENSTGSN